MFTKELISQPCCTPYDICVQSESSNSGTLSNTQTITQIIYETPMYSIKTLKQKPCI